MTGPVGGAGELTAGELAELWGKTSKQCRYGYLSTPSDVWWKAFAFNVNAALAAKAPQGVPKLKQQEVETILHSFKTSTNPHFDWLEHYAKITRALNGVLLDKAKALATPPAPSLPVPGPVSAPASERPFALDEIEFTPVTSCNASRVETEEGAGSATRYVTSPSSAQDQPTPAPGAERSAPQVHPNRKTVIAHAQARAALQHFVNRHFNNPGEKSRASIPAHQDDDDILLFDYITQREALAAAPPADTLTAEMAAKEGINKDQFKMLPKLFRWQAESLEAFRAKFGVESNCQALDAIDELLGDRHASAERVRKLIAKWREQPKYQDTMPLSSEAQAVVFTRSVCADELERALPPSTGEKSQ